MSDVSRRDFLRQGSLGLAGIGGAGLVLRADARPTESAGNLGNYARYLAGERRQQQNRVPDNGKRNEYQNVAPPAKWALTEDNILGPFYRSGAPFRAKITPPLEAGTVLVISGRVW